MKVYISGKITGLPFLGVQVKFQVAELLMENLGLEAVNPLKNGLSLEDEWKKQLLVGIDNLLLCDIIYMLDNWLDDTRARIEKNIADEKGIPVWFETNVVRVHEDVKRIQNAIHEVTGLSFNSYNNTCRKRELFFARLLFVHYCDKSGIIQSDISRYIRHERTSVLHNLNTYDTEVKFNPKFRTLAKQVDELLTK